MGDIHNLKQFKKRAERDVAAKTAETNRARFGRTKVEKDRDQLMAQRASSSLDGHRIDDETSA